MHSLREREWESFFLEDICEIYAGTRLTKENMLPGHIPFVGATSSNNGVTAYVSNMNSSYKSGVLGVNYNGSVVENFYHPYGALFSDDVKQLRIKGKARTKYAYLFLKTMILQQKMKYAYGYKFNERRMRRQLIMLPTNELGEPDWQFMESYMRERENLLVDRYQTYIKNEISALEESRGGALSVADLEWRQFKITDIFSMIKRGKRLKRANHVEGDTPYISSTAQKNGIDGYCGNLQGVRSYSKCLTLANSGSVGSCFYHPYQFIASDHVTALKSKETDKYTCLFLATLFLRLGEKYSFNREISDRRLRRETTILPVDERGNIAWSSMSDYIRGQELALLKQVLECSKMFQKKQQM